MRKLENNELERKSVADFKSSAKTPIIIVLDDVRSLHNIGSVFRTADALIEKYIYVASLQHHQIKKFTTALGATETVTWQYNKMCLK
jgi:tRNA G18 (ribose-2'-O)-methylase SpoU